MISRRTIFSLILTLLIASGLRVWVVQHRDDCDRPATHNGGRPRSVMVESGTQMIEMPCDVWLPRQPIGVQLTCLLDLVVFVVFLLSVWGDRSRARERRQLGR